MRNEGSSITCPVDGRTRLSLTADFPEKTATVRVFYLVNREALSSVFTSQVLAPLSQHQDLVHVRLVAFMPIGHRLRGEWRRKMEAVKTLAEKRYNLPMTCLTAPPARWRELWNEARVLRRWLQRQHQGSGPIVLHCRNAEMTSIALDAASRLPRTRVIFDSRGAEVEEYLHEHSLNPCERENWPAAHRRRFDELRIRQQRVVHQSDHVTCVSSAMRQQLVESYGLDALRSTVIPCCPDIEQFTISAEERSRVRRELNLEDRLAVTYCGSMAWYQCPQQALRIFRLIAAMQPQAHFFAITTQPDMMRREIRAAGIDGAKTSVVSVPPQVVPQYLAAGDLGLLLREDTVVNRVASPVKFGEYLAAGLPVIISAGVGDFSFAVQTHQLGTVVSLSDSDDSISHCIQSLATSHDLRDRTMSDRCRAYAGAYLSWSTHIPRVAEIYRQLLTLDSGTLR